MSTLVLALYLGLGGLAGPPGPIFLDSSFRCRRGRHVLLFGRFLIGP